VPKYDNTNSGVLFKNEDKQSEKHSDYRGELNAAGVDYWIDGWVKISKKTRQRFISFRLKPKKGATKATAPSFDDDVPF
jgi:hypothetical protein